MALDVIGAGFGRTGTLSLKFALEKLGFNKTYHMMELFQHPEHLEHWQQALATRSCDWANLFDGYRAAVDWPACSYWPELAEQYPDAKVILSLRNPDSWFKSIHNTIYPSTKQAMTDANPLVKSHGEWANQLIWEDTFDGRVEEKDHAIDVFNANVEKVKAAIPADRLLVFQASDGWKPLCEFLGCEIPDEPYPRVNSTEEFQNR